MVDFSSEDNLVFMLGDGVNQYVNTKLNKDEHSLSKALRATPHAAKLQAHVKHLAGVWYGLMVLPPTSEYSEAGKITYGEIRNLLTSTKNEDIPVGLGCSSTQMRALEGGDDRKAIDSLDESVSTSKLIWTKHYLFISISSLVCIFSLAKFTL